MELIICPKCKEHRPVELMEEVELEVRNVATFYNQYLRENNGRYFKRTRWCSMCINKAQGRKNTKENKEEELPDYLRKAIADGKVNLK